RRSNRRCQPGAEERGGGSAEHGSRGPEALDELECRARRKPRNDGEAEPGERVVLVKRRLRHYSHAETEAATIPAEALQTSLAFSHDSAPQARGQGQVAGAGALVARNLLPALKVIEPPKLIQ